MERVLGLGGAFWRSDDPERLKEWYRSRLGVEGEGDLPWRQQAGLTVFEPFRRDTTYFASDRQQVMFNFRVRDLDAMVAQLRDLGEEVRVDEPYSYGRFARLQDPEGNAVELWQPTGPGSDPE
jgi:predicted enzyme related to lactoylglutathione lyase